MRDDCNYVSTHSGVASTRTYILAHISEQPDSTVTATRVETPSGIVISCDEIDNEKADTFSPFVPEQTQSDTLPVKREEYLSLITFEGTQSLIQTLLKQLYQLYTKLYPCLIHNLKKSRCLITPWWDMEEYYEPLNTSKG